MITKTPKIERILQKVKMTGVPRIEQELNEKVAYLAYIIEQEDKDFKIPCNW